MPTNADQETALQSNFDPRLQSENIAFERNAMLSCSKCSRANPPNRFKCFYCGSELDLPDERVAAITSTFRRLEPWERGVNVILSKTSVDADLKMAASILSLETDEVGLILECGKGFPLARVEDASAAGNMIARLRSVGIECFSVDDSEVKFDSKPIRIGSVDFGSGEVGFKDFNTGKIDFFRSYEIALVVEGWVSKTRTDSVEKRRLRGGSKPVDQASMTTDDRILDIYPSGDHAGFRIMPAGFDFSCLGQQRALLARENWGRILDLFKTKLPSAEFVLNYPEIRSALDPVWPVESRNETKGMINTGFGKREFGSIATTTNLKQFDRYSRLQKYLYETKR
ncbi:MAG: zinc ribbon domain-containing protein [Pyrinomonadaceae bacterium]